MPEQPRVLVTGATGTVGPELVRLLCATGRQVRVLVRRAPPPGLLPPGIEAIEGDIDDASVLNRAVRQTDCIYHLAAKLHITNPVPELRADYERVNVEATGRLATAAADAGVRRLVFFSTINVYGPSRAGQTHTEDSPLNPDSWYAESKARAEEIVLRHCPAVVLRLAAVYGPVMKGNYPRLVTALEHGRFLPIGDGRNRRTLIHTHDVCQAALLAGSHPEAVGAVFNVTDGQVHPMREIIHAICAALGRRPPRLHLPAGGVMSAVALLESSLGKFGRATPVKTATLRKLLEDMAVDGSRLRQQLGFVSAFDLHTGWQQAIRGMKHSSDRDLPLVRAA